MTMDVNAASRKDLIAVTGIGEELAGAITRARPFASIDDLLSIPGVGARTLERLKQQGLIAVRQKRARGLIVVDRATLEDGLRKLEELEAQDPHWKEERARIERDIAEERALRDREHASRKAETQEGEVH